MGDTPQVQMPETRYARSGDVNIAYQVVGDGPVDLLWIPVFAQHVELSWEEPYRRAWLEALAAEYRLIVFDKRGTGLSDRVAGAPRSRCGWTTAGLCWMRPGPNAQRSSQQASRPISH